jgi:hypothetical protein
MNEINILNFIQITGLPKSSRFFEAIVNSWTITNSLDEKKTLTTIHFEITENVINDEFNFFKKNWAVSQASIIHKDPFGKYLKINKDIITSKVCIQIDPSFHIPTFKHFFESLVFFKSIQNKKVPIHSGAINLNDKGILFPAWGGTGKTRLLLHSYIKRNARISDEWNFLDNNSIIPYNNEVLLMHYDIKKFPVLVSKLDLLRANIYRSVNSNVLKLVLERLKLGLKYKKIPSGSTETMPLHSIIFMQKTTSTKEVLKKITPKVMANFISLNFKHEKEDLHYMCSLFKQIEINNFDLQNVYLDALQLILKDKDCHLLTIPMTKEINPINLEKQINETIL